MSSAARIMGLLLAASACGPSRGATVNDPGADISTPGPAPGTAGSGSGGSSIVDLPTGSGGASAAPPQDETCAAETLVGERLPLDVFVLLDQSGSMTEDDDRWGPVTAAILAFIDDPASHGIGVGLQYFPLGAKMREDPVICEASTYRAPAVAFADLPAAAAPMRASIDAHTFGPAEADTAPHWGTPTRPAVEGVMGYLQEWRTQHPDRRTVLLLATDGQPSKFCARNRIDDIADVLAAAARPPLSVASYVIGIGDIENLQELAAAGATGKGPFVVSGSGGDAIRSEFLAALQAIRSAAVPCAVRIPQGMGALDLDKVNVQIANAAGTSAVVPRVNGADACKPEVPAWHLDVADKPSALVMCPAACDQLSAPGARIDVLIGCATLVID